MGKNIAIIGTLDTKGEELKYLKELIEGKGFKALVIDVSCQKHLLHADFSNEEVAKKMGMTMKEVTVLEEGEAIRVMASGASGIAQELCSSGELDGVIAIGGTMGTWLGEAVLRALPLGLPKLMVSTVAFSPFVDSQVASPGQMLTDCVAGLWGLNTISKAMLNNAVAAMAGMVEGHRKITPEKPIAGITTLGSVVFNYTFQLKPLLEERGYEMAVFHAHETGGRALELAINEGLISVVLDLCLYDLANYVAGGSWSSGPDRLEAAGKKGIPQIIAPGGTDFIGLAASPDAIPQQFRNRAFHSHNPKDTCVMTSPDEKAAIGKLIAQKLNRATGPTVAILPWRGFSEWSREGKIFCDPEGDGRLIRAFKENIQPKIKVIELDAHINDLVFIDTVIATLDDVMRK